MLYDALLTSKCWNILNFDLNPSKLEPFKRFQMKKRNNFSGLNVMVPYCELKKKKFNLLSCNDKLVCALLSVCKTLSFKYIILKLNSLIFILEISNYLLRRKPLYFGYYCLPEIRRCRKKINVAASM